MRKKKTGLPVKILMVMHTSSITGPSMATISLLKAIDRDRFRVEVAAPADGPFVGSLKDIDIPHIPLEFGRFRDIFTALRLAGILIKGKHDIVHGHMGRVGPIIYAAGKIAGHPAIILTEHMSAETHIWIGRNAIKLFCHRLFHIVSNHCVDMVIAVSEKARRSYVSRQGIKKEKTITIHNGIYLDEKKEPRGMAVRESLGFDRDAVIIGMFGRLVKEKGYSDVIVAAEEILRHSKNARFLMVGDGPERESLEKLADSRHLGGKMVFMGFRQDAYDIMGAIDILVQPSWTESSESFGLVLVEAMANSKSVIASNIEPFFEIIEDGNNGFLFPEKNPGALAGKVKSILDDRGLMDRMGERGYQIVREKFDARIAARKTEDVYMDVLRTKGYR